MTDAQQKLDNMLDDFDNAMLVTRTAGDELRARPMAIADHRADGDLFFATSMDSAKCDELMAHPSVGVTLQGDGEYISISGSAVIVNDRQLIEKLYDPIWQAWFPEGKDDPDLRLIRFSARRGEYWDQSGAERLRFLWRAGRAILRGDEMEPAEPQGHAKVEL